MKVDAKAHILNAAVKLIQEGRAPADITVRDIAAEANTQLAMINYYFRTKDELMYQAVGVLRYKLASNVLSKDEEKSAATNGAYIQFREMLISICDMSVNYSHYMRFTVEYELTKAEIVAPQYFIPLIREIYAASSGGDKISETSIRIKAYEIISILQLIFFRAKDISNYLGFDVLEYDRMVEVIDTILKDHFPDHR